MLIADPAPESRANLVNMLRAQNDITIAGEARTTEQVLESAQTLHPDLVVLDLALPGESVVALVERLREERAGMGCIALASHADLQGMRQLMRAGVQDVLPKPVQPETLMESVRTVHATLQRMHAPRAPVGAPAPLGEVLTVFSPQGGSGKSIVAVNLAVVLARATRGSVVLADLNLQFGDVHLLLDLEPDFTIAQLAQKHPTGYVDAETVESFLMTHAASGLKVLAAPASPQQAENVTVHVVEQTLEALQTKYEYVIVDTPTHLEGVIFAPLAAARAVLLVTTLDLLAIHKTQMALAVLRQLYGNEKLKLVLNRSGLEMGLSAADVESTLDLRIAAHIPSAGPVVVKSVNEGVPFVLSAPDSAVAQSIVALAGILVGQERLKEWGVELASRRRGFWQRLLGE